MDPSAYSNLEDLPDPEDYLAEHGMAGLKHLIEFWEMSLEAMSQYITENITDKSEISARIVDRETKLSRWLDQAHCFLE